MRGAVISLRALLAFCLSVQSVPSKLPGSRMVVTPWPIQSLKTYSAGVPWSLPPMCACMSTKPGSTYMPARSISRSPFAALGRLSGSMPPGWPTLSTRTMRCFSITMSTGPIAGAPVPSISVAPRRMSRANGPSPSARGGASGIDLSLAEVGGMAGVSAVAPLVVLAAGTAFASLAGIAAGAAMAAGSPGAGSAVPAVPAAAVLPVPAAAAQSRIIMAPRERPHREALMGRLLLSASRTGGQLQCRKQATGRAAARVDAWIVRRNLHHRGGPLVGPGRTEIQADLRRQDAAHSDSRGGPRPPCLPRACAPDASDQSGDRQGGAGGEGGGAS